jgi:hypothetical protein
VKTYAMFSALAWCIFSHMQCIFLIDMYDD